MITEGDRIFAWRAKSFLKNSGDGRDISGNPMESNGFINIAGWWFQPTPLNNDGLKVSWDGDIPN